MCHVLQQRDEAEDKLAAANATLQDIRASGTDPGDSAALYRLREAIDAELPEVDDDEPDPYGRAIRRAGHTLASRAQLIDALKEERDALLTYARAIESAIGDAVDAFDTLPPDVAEQVRETGP